MPYIVGVLQEEMIRMEKARKCYTFELIRYSKGQLVPHKVKDRVYYYLTYRDTENKKVKTKYIKKKDVAELQQQIERRDGILQAIKNIDENLAVIYYALHIKPESRKQYRDVLTASVECEDDGGVTDE